MTKNICQDRKASRSIAAWWAGHTAALAQALDLGVVNIDTENRDLVEVYQTCEHLTGGRRSSLASSCPERKTLAWR